MENMSDSQFEFEDKYDDDFCDDVSVDENNQDDSGMEEKVAYKHSYETDTDNETFRKKNVPSRTPPSRTPKRGNAKVNANGRDKKTPTRISDPYKSYSTPTTRRAQSDPRSRKPKSQVKLISSKGSSSKQGPNDKVAPNAIIKRVLSASRKKASTLNNVIYDLQQQIDGLSVANRDLKRNAHVQNRDLRKLDCAEAQLPVLMKKHSDDINVLQEKYKQQKDVSMRLNENLKKVDNELLKTKDKLKEYQVMAKEKNLGERIELKNNVLDLEKVIEQKDNKIAELNRNLGLQKKIHGRIIKEKNDKYEKAVGKVKLLEEVQKDLVSRLKDREKALEVTNIYSRRVPKDGKQIVMFSPKDPIAPILKKCQDENFDILKTLDAKLESYETVESEARFTSSSVGERIDTMVSRSDNEHEVEEMTSPRVKETVKTFLTQGKLKRDESEDFYDVNNNYEIVKVKKENGSKPRTPKSAAAMESDSLGEDQLHERLDEMMEKGKGRDKGDANVKKEHESVQQSQLEKSVEQMSIVTKGSEIKSPQLDEEAKRRKLLLAKIQAIDNGEDPNDVTPASVEPRKISEKKTKPYKKPIFLERSSTNTSDDDLSSVKSLDASSGSNSKSNSATSTSRRIRPFPDSHSETDSPVKTKARKDSLDSDLHKGYPVYTDSAASTNRVLPPPIRNNDRSLTGALGNKNRTNRNTSDKNTLSRFDTNYSPTALDTNTGQNTKNTLSRFDTNYSPTALDTNTGENKKTIKKNTFDLFDQFVDPFKNSSTNTTDDEDSHSIRFKNVSSANEPAKNHGNDAGELFAKTNKGGQTPDSTVLDDLEEMFIL